MTKTENYLVVVSRGCSDIQKAVSNALRFGIDSHQPELESNTNAENIIYSFYQLAAIVTHLQHCNILPEWNDDVVQGIMADAVKNAAGWQEVSRRLGVLEKEAGDAND